MLISEITHDGQTSLNVTQEEAEGLGYPKEVIKAALAKQEKVAALADVGITQPKVFAALCAFFRLAEDAKDLAAVKAASADFLKTTAPYISSEQRG
jgi:hypothetical protein